MSSTAIGRAAPKRRGPSTFHEWQRSKMAPAYVRERAAMEDAFTALVRGPARTSDLKHYLPLLTRQDGHVVQLAWRSFELVVDLARAAYRDTKRGAERPGVRRKLQSVLEQVDVLSRPKTGPLTLFLRLLRAHAERFHNGDGRAPQHLIWAVQGLDPKLSRLDLRFVTEQLRQLRPTRPARGPAAASDHLVAARLSAAVGAFNVTDPRTDQRRFRAADRG